MILWLERCVNNEILVVETTKETIYDVPIERLLEQLANESFSTLQGKMKASAKRLKHAYKRPLLFHADLILCPIYGLRSRHTLFINIASIHHIEYKNKSTALLYFHQFSKKREVPRRIIRHQLKMVNELLAGQIDKKMLT